MKVIQVGLGGMGNAWLNAMLATPTVEYAGFVEINDSIARAQTERYGLDASLVFHSLEQALATVEADGVLDITPPQFHRSVALTALEHGIPVLSEKPLADTLEAGREIVQKSSETGVLHMVAQNRRYTVPSQTLKHVLNSGEMGTVASVGVEFFRGPHFGGFREEMPYPLIIDMAIHHFDMMRFFLDSDPITISGRSWNPPWSWYKGDASASVLMDFASGAVVSYDGSWCSRGVETSWNGHWRFECENGVVLMQNDQVFVGRNEEARSLTAASDGDALLPVPALTIPYTDQVYLLREFYEAVVNGSAPATTCQDNIKSLAMVFDAVRSFESGAAVPSRSPLA
jgi:predicted dehydrogenase